MALAKHIPRSMCHQQGGLSFGPPGPLPLEPHRGLVEDDDVDTPALLPGLILQDLQGGRDKVQLFTLAVKAPQSYWHLRQTTTAWNETSLPAYLCLVHSSLPTQLEGHPFQEASTAP